MIESHENPPVATTLILHLVYMPNPLLDGATDLSPSGNTSNPQVDEGFAKTWSINCSTPAPPRYSSVGEIVIKQNSDNTINCVDMKLYGRNMSDKSKWIGFRMTNGFSSYDGDPSYLVVTGITWVLGPGGKPDDLDSPPGVTDVGGNPECN